MVKSDLIKLHEDSITLAGSGRHITVSVMFSVHRKKTLHAAGDTTVAGTLTM